MANPVDSARVATNISTGATSHVINVGSPVAETLLIVFFRTNTGPGTLTFTGYTPLVSAQSDASNDLTAVYYRWADGTEGVDDALTTTNVCKIAAICWEVTGAENPATQAPEISTVTTFTTAANTADPGSVAGTGGSKDYLFLAMAGCDGEVGAFTAAPTNYTNFQAANTGTGGTPATNCIIGGGSRQLTAASDDPGTFTHAAGVTGGSAYTVVVHPASGAPPPSFQPRPAAVQLQGLGVV